MNKQLIDNQKPQKPSRYQPSQSLGIRAIAAFVAFSFFAQDLSFAAIDLNARHEARPSSFSLPQNIGIVKEAVTQKNPEIIINIKDIHDNFSAQESIASILENLVANYDIKTVGVEGSSGLIDTSLLSALPDPAMRKNTADFLMKEGRISAGEFFSAMNDGNIALYGMDDEKLYEENLAAFKACLRDKKDIFPKVDALKNALTLLGPSVFSPDLMELEKNGILVNNGSLKFSERWKIISTLADKNHVDYLAYPNIKNLLQSVQSEKTLDFKAASSQRDTLVDVLARKLPKDKLERLMEQSISYKLGRVSQGSFSSYLLNAASDAALDLSKYGDLKKYSDYMLLYESLDVDSLKEEVLTVEEKIRDKIYRNDDERRLHAILKDVSALSDLLEVKLSSESLRYFKARAGEFTAERFRTFLNGQAAKHGIQSGPVDIDGIFAAVPEFMKFYESAEKRNEALLANTVQKMRASGQHVACLVTGGFHSKGITELLKNKQMSYIVILPRFNKKSTRPYLTIVTNQAASYKQFAESEQVLETKLRMTAHFFSQVAFAAIAKESSLSDARKNQLIALEIEKAKAAYLNHLGTRQITSLKTSAQSSKASAIPPTQASATMIAPWSQLSGKAVAGPMQVVYSAGRLGIYFQGTNGESRLMFAALSKEGVYLEGGSELKGASADAVFESLKTGGAQVSDIQKEDLETPEKLSDWSWEQTVKKYERMNDDELEAANDEITARGGKIGSQTRLLEKENTQEQLRNNKQYQVLLAAREDNKKNYFAISPFLGPMTLRRSEAEYAAFESMPAPADRKQYTREEVESLATGKTSLQFEGATYNLASPGSYTSKMENLTINGETLFLAHGTYTARKMNGDQAGELVVFNFFELRDGSGYAFVVDNKKTERVRLNSDLIGRSLESDQVHTRDEHVELNDAIQAILSEQARDIGSGVKKTINPLDKKTRFELKDYMRSASGKTDRRITEEKTKNGQTVRVLRMSSFTLAYNVELDMLLDIDSSFKEDHYGHSTRLAYASTPEIAPHEILELLVWEMIWEAMGVPVTSARAEILHQLETSKLANASDGRDETSAIKRLHDRIHGLAAKLFGFKDSKTGAYVGTNKDIKTPVDIFNAVNEALPGALEEIFNKASGTSEDLLGLSVGTQREASGAQTSSDITTQATATKETAVDTSSRSQTPLSPSTSASAASQDLDAAKRAQSENQATGWKIVPQKSDHPGPKITKEEIMGTQDGQAASLEILKGRCTYSQEIPSTLDRGGQFKAVTLRLTTTYAADSSEYNLEIRTPGGVWVAAIVNIKDLSAVAKVLKEWRLRNAPGNDLFYQDYAESLLQLLIDKKLIPKSTRPESPRGLLIDQLTALREKIVPRASGFSRAAAWLRQTAQQKEALGVIDVMLKSARETAENGGGFSSSFYTDSLNKIAGNFSELSHEIENILELCKAADAETQIVFDRLKFEESKKKSAPKTAKTPVAKTPASPKTAPKAPMVSTAASDANVPAAQDWSWQDGGTNTIEHTAGVSGTMAYTDSGGKQVTARFACEQTQDGRMTGASYRLSGVKSKAWISMVRIKSGDIQVTMHFEDGTSQTYAEKTGSFDGQGFGNSQDAMAGHETATRSNGVIWARFMAERLARHLQTPTQAPAILASAEAEDAFYDAYGQMRQVLGYNDDGKIAGEEKIRAALAGFKKAINNCKKAGFEFDATIQGQVDILLKKSEDVLAEKPVSPMTQKDASSKTKTKPVSNSVKGPLDRAAAEAGEREAKAPAANPVRTHQLTPEENQMREQILSQNEELFRPQGPSEQRNAYLKAGEGATTILSDLMSNPQVLDETFHSALARAGDIYVRTDAGGNSQYYEVVQASDFGARSNGRLLVSVALREIAARTVTAPQIQAPDTDATLRRVVFHQPVQAVPMEHASSKSKPAALAKEPLQRAANKRAELVEAQRVSEEKAKAAAAKKRSTGRPEIDQKRERSIAQIEDAIEAADLVGDQKAPKGEENRNIDTVIKGINRVFGSAGGNSMEQDSIDLEYYRTLQDLMGQARKKRTELMKVKGQPAASTEDVDVDESIRQSAAQADAFRAVVEEKTLQITKEKTAIDKALEKGEDATALIAFYESTLDDAAESGVTVKAQREELAALKARNLKNIEAAEQAKTDQAAQEKTAQRDKIQALQKQLRLDHEAEDRELAEAAEQVLASDQFTSERERDLRASNDVSSKEFGTNYALFYEDREEGPEFVWLFHGTTDVDSLARGIDPGKAGTAIGTTKGEARGTLFLTPSFEEAMTYVQRYRLGAALGKDYPDPGIVLVRVRRRAGVTEGGEVRIANPQADIQKGDIVPLKAALNIIRETAARKVEADSAAQEATQNEEADRIAAEKAKAESQAAAQALAAKQEADRIAEAKKILISDAESTGKALEQAIKNGGNVPLAITAYKTALDKAETEAGKNVDKQRAELKVLEERLEAAALKKAKQAQAAADALKAAEEAKVLQAAQEAQAKKDAQELAEKNAKEAEAERIAQEAQAKKDAEALAEKQKEEAAAELLKQQEEEARLEKERVAREEEAQILREIESMSAALAETLSEELSAEEAGERRQTYSDLMKQTLASAMEYQNIAGMELAAIALANIERKEGALQEALGAGAVSHDLIKKEDDGTLNIVVETAVKSAKENLIAALRGLWDSSAMSDAQCRVLAHLLRRQMLLMRKSSNVFVRETQQLRFKIVQNSPVLMFVKGSVIYLDISLLTKFQNLSYKQAAIFMRYAFAHEFVHLGQNEKREDKTRALIERERDAILSDLNNFSEARASERAEILEVMKSMGFAKAPYIQILQLVHEQKLKKEKQALEKAALEKTAAEVQAAPAVVTEPVSKESEDAAPAVLEEAAPTTGPPASAENVKAEEAPVQETAAETAVPATQTSLWEKPVFDDDGVAGESLEFTQSLDSGEEDGGYLWDEIAEKVEEATVAPQAVASTAKAAAPAAAEVSLPHSKKADILAALKAIKAATDSGDHDKANELFLQFFTDFGILNKNGVFVSTGNAALDHKLFNELKRLNAWKEQKNFLEGFREALEAVVLDENNPTQADLRAIRESLLLDNTGLVAQKNLFALVLKFLKTDGYIDGPKFLADLKGINGEAAAKILSFLRLSLKVFRVKLVNYGLQLADSKVAAKKRTGQWDEKAYGYLIAQIRRLQEGDREVEHEAREAFRIALEAEVVQAAASGPSSSPYAKPEVRQAVEGMGQSLAARDDEGFNESFFTLMDNLKDENGNLHQGTSFDYNRKFEEQVAKWEDSVAKDHEALVEKWGSSPSGYGEMLEALDKAQDGDFYVTYPHELQNQPNLISRKAVAEYVTERTRSDLRAILKSENGDAAKEFWAAFTIFEDSKSKSKIFEDSKSKSKIFVHNGKQYYSEAIKKEMSRVFANHRELASLEKKLLLLEGTTDSEGKPVEFKTLSGETVTLGSLSPEQAEARKAEILRVQCEIAQIKLTLKQGTEKDLNDAKQRLAGMHAARDDIGFWAIFYEVDKKTLQECQDLVNAGHLVIGANENAEDDTRYGALERLQKLVAGDQFSNLRNGRLTFKQSDPINVLAYTLMARLVQTSTKKTLAAALSNRDPKKNPFFFNELENEQEEYLLTAFLFKQATGFYLMNKQLISIAKFRDFNLAAGTGTGKTFVEFAAAALQIAHMLGDNARKSDKGAVFINVPNLALVTQFLEKEEHIQFVRMMTGDEKFSLLNGKEQLLDTLQAKHDETTIVEILSKPCIVVIDMQSAGFLRQNSRTLGNQVCAHLEHTVEFIDEGDALYTNLSDYVGSTGEKEKKDMTSAELARFELMQRKRSEALKQNQLRIETAARITKGIDLTKPAQVLFTDEHGRKVEGWKVSPEALKGKSLTIVTDLEYFTDVYAEDGENPVVYLDQVTREVLINDGVKNCFAELEPDLKKGSTDNSEKGHRLDGLDRGHLQTVIAVQLLPAGKVDRFRSITYIPEKKQYIYVKDGQLRTSQIPGDLQLLQALNERRKELGVSEKLDFAEHFADVTVLDTSGGVSGFELFRKESNDKALERQMLKDEEWMRASAQFKDAGERAKGIQRWKEEFLAKNARWRRDNESFIRMGSATQGEVVEFGLLMQGVGVFDVDTFKSSQKGTFSSFDLWEMLGGEEGRMKSSITGKDGQPHPRYKSFKKATFAEKLDFLKNQVDQWLVFEDGPRYKEDVKLADKTVTHRAGDVHQDSSMLICFGETDGDLKQALHEYLLSKRDQHIIDMLDEIDGSKQDDPTQVEKTTQKVAEKNGKIRRRVIFTDQVGTRGNDFQAHLMIVNLSQQMSGGGKMQLWGRGGRSDMSRGGNYDVAWADVIDETALGSMLNDFFHMKDAMLKFIAASGDYFHPRTRALFEDLGSMSREDALAYLMKEEHVLECTVFQSEWNLIRQKEQAMMRLWSAGLMYTAVTKHINEALSILRKDPVANEKMITRLENMNNELFAKEGNTSSTEHVNLSNHSRNSAQIAQETFKGVISRAQTLFKEFIGSDTEIEKDTSNQQVRNILLHARNNVEQMSSKELATDFKGEIPEGLHAGNADTLEEMAQLHSLFETAFAPSHTTSQKPVEEMAQLVQNQARGTADIYGQLTAAEKGGYFDSAWTDSSRLESLERSMLSAVLTKLTDDEKKLIDKAGPLPFSIAQKLTAQERDAIARRRFFYERTPNFNNLSLSEKQQLAINCFSSPNPPDFKKMFPEHPAADFFTVLTPSQKKDLIGKFDEAQLDQAARRQFFYENFESLTKGALSRMMAKFHSGNSYWREKEEVLGILDRLRSADPLAAGLLQTIITLMDSNDSAAPRVMDHLRSELNDHFEKANLGFFIYTRSDGESTTRLSVYTTQGRTPRDIDRGKLGVRKVDALLLERIDRMPDEISASINVAESLGNGNFVPIYLDKIRDNVRDQMVEKATGLIQEVLDAILADYDVIVEKQKTNTAENFRSGANHQLLGNSGSGIRVTDDGTISYNWKEHENELKQAIEDDYRIEDDYEKTRLARKRGEQIEGLVQQINVGLIGARSKLKVAEDDRAGDRAEIKKKVEFLKADANLRVNLFKEIIPNFESMRNDKKRLLDVITAAEVDMLTTHEFGHETDQLNIGSDKYGALRGGDREYVAHLVSMLGRNGLMALEQIYGYHSMAPNNDGWKENYKIPTLRILHALAAKFGLKEDGKFKDAKYAFTEDVEKFDESEEEKDKNLAGMRALILELAVEFKKGDILFRNRIEEILDEEAAQRGVVLNFSTLRDDGKGKKTTPAALEVPAPPSETEHADREAAAANILPAMRGVLLRAIQGGAGDGEKGAGDKREEPKKILMELETSNAGAPPKPPPPAAIALFCRVLGIPPGSDEDREKNFWARAEAALKLRAMSAADRILSAKMNHQDLLQQFDSAIEAAIELSALAERAGSENHGILDFAIARADKKIKKSLLSAIDPDTPKSDAGLKAAARLGAPGAKEGAPKALSLKDRVLLLKPGTDVEKYRNQIDLVRNMLGIVVVGADSIDTARKLLDIPPGKADLAAADLLEADLLRAGLQLNSPAQSADLLDVIYRNVAGEKIYSLDAARHLNRTGDVSPAGEKMREAQSRALDKGLVDEHLTEAFFSGAQLMKDTYGGDALMSELSAKAIDAIVQTALEESMIEMNREHPELQDIIHQTFQMAKGDPKNPAAALKKAAEYFGEESGKRAKSSGRKNLPHSVSIKMKNSTHELGKLADALTAASAPAAAAPNPAAAEKLIAVLDVLEASGETVHLNGREISFKSLIEELKKISDPAVGFSIDRDKGLLMIDTVSGHRVFSRTLNKQAAVSSEIFAGADKVQFHPLRPDLKYVENEVLEIYNEEMNNLAQRIKQTNEEYQKESAGQDMARIIGLMNEQRELRAVYRQLQDYDVEAATDRAMRNVYSQSKPLSVVLNETKADLMTYRESLKYVDEEYKKGPGYLQAVATAQAELNKAVGRARQEAHERGLEEEEAFLSDENTPQLSRQLVPIKQKDWSRLRVAVPDETGRIRYRSVGADIKEVTLWGAGIVLLPADKQITQNQLTGLLIHESGHLFPDFQDKTWSEGLTEWRAREMLRAVNGDSAVREYMGLVGKGSDRGLYYSEVETMKGFFSDADPALIDLARFTGNPAILTGKKTGKAMPPSMMAARGRLGIKEAFRDPQTATPEAIERFISGKPVTTEKAYQLLLGPAMGTEIFKFIGKSGKVHSEIKTSSIHQIQELIKEEPARVEKLRPDAQGLLLHGEEISGVVTISGIARFAEDNGVEISDLYELAGLKEAPRLARITRLIMEFNPSSRLPLKEAFDTLTGIKPDFDKKFTVQKDGQTFLSGEATVPGLMAFMLDKVLPADLVFELCAMLFGEEPGLKIGRLVRDIYKADPFLVVPLSFLRGVVEKTPDMTAAEAANEFRRLIEEERAKDSLVAGGVIDAKTGQLDPEARVSRLTAALGADIEKIASFFKNFEIEGAAGRRLAEALLNNPGSDLKLLNVLYIVKHMIEGGMKIENMRPNELWEELRQRSELLEASQPSASASKQPVNPKPKAAQPQAKPAPKSAMKKVNKQLKPKKGPADKDKDVPPGARLAQESPAVDFTGVDLRNRFMVLAARDIPVVSLSGDANEEISLLESEKLITTVLGNPKTVRAEAVGVPVALFGFSDQQREELLGLIPQAIAQMDPKAAERLRTKFNAASNPFVIVPLERSQALFEDESANGFIGISRLLMDAPDSPAKTALLVAGLRHHLGLEAIDHAKAKKSKRIFDFIQSQKDVLYLHQQGILAKDLRSLGLLDEHSEVLWQLGLIELSVQKGLDLFSDPGIAAAFRYPDAKVRQVFLVDLENLLQKPMKAGDSAAAAAFRMSQIKQLARNTLDKNQQARKTLEARTAEGGDLRGIDQAMNQVFLNGERSDFPTMRAYISSRYGESCYLEILESIHTMLQWSTFPVAEIKSLSDLDLFFDYVWARDGSAIFEDSEGLPVFSWQNYLQNSPVMFSDFLENFIEKKGPLDNMESIARSMNNFYPTAPQLLNTAFINKLTSDQPVSSRDFLDGEPESRKRLQEMLNRRDYFSATEIGPSEKASRIRQALHDLFVLRVSAHTHQPFGSAVRAIRVNIDRLTHVQKNYDNANASYEFGEELINQRFVGRGDLLAVMAHENGHNFLLSIGVPHNSLSAAALHELMSDVEAFAMLEELGESIHDIKRELHYAEMMDRVEWGRDEEHIRGRAVLQAFLEKAGDTNFSWRNLRDRLYDRLMSRAGSHYSDLDTEDFLANFSETAMNIIQNKGARLVFSKTETFQETVSAKVLVGVLGRPGVENEDFGPDVKIVTVEGARLSADGNRRLIAELNQEAETKPDVTVLVDGRDISLDLKKTIQEAVQEGRDQYFLKNIRPVLKNLPAGEQERLFAIIKDEQLSPTDVLRSIDEAFARGTFESASRKYMTGFPGTGTSEVRSAPEPAAMILDEPMIQGIQAGAKKDIFWQTVSKIQNLDLCVIGSEEKMGALPVKNVKFYANRAEAAKALLAKNIKPGNISFGYQREGKTGQALAEEIQTGTIAGAKVLIAGDPAAYADPVVLLAGFFSQENVYVGAQDDEFIKKLDGLLHRSMRWLSSIDIDRMIRLAARIAQATEQAA